MGARRPTRLPAARPALAFFAALGLAACGSDPAPGQQPATRIVAGAPAQTLAEFESVLESHRASLNIPGIAAAIVKDQRIVWARGFGSANVEAGVEATADTPFHLASLTKTFASTVIVRLVEDGILDLEAPVSDFGVQIDSPGVVRVRHLLTHTSEGVPGASYSYNGGRFAHLDTVVLAASGTSFCDLLVDTILVPLGLQDTAPNPLARDSCFFSTTAERDAFRQRMAQGYTSDGRARQEYPEHFSVSAGLVASARDVARYSIAIDQHRFLSPEAQERAFTPAVSNSGQTLPYGLGWFIQDHPRGARVIWHYGYWTANSSLIVRVPERGLAFILLANTDMLSRGSRSLGEDENVERSAWATEFLNAFVFGDAELPD